MVSMTLDWDTVDTHLGSEPDFEVIQAAPESVAQDVGLRLNVIDDELMQLKALQTDSIGRPGRQLRFKIRGVAPAE
eukprot:9360571-Pyramimonas_sp.AAC.1